MSTPAGWYPQADGQQRYWDGEQWTENFAPGTPLVTPPAAARKNWFLRHKLITAVGAVLLLAMFSGIASGGGTKSVNIAPAADSVATSSAADKAAADQAAADKAAAAKAVADKAAAAKAAAAKAVADKAAAAKAAAAKAAADKAAAAKAAAWKNPATYKSMSARNFALLVKNPDAHIGEKLVIYGYISQFDAATGTATFLAQVASVRKADWYEYDENVMATAADANDFTRVVEGDKVTLYVEVMGSFSYDTQAGGNTTVPQVRVHIVKVTGSTK